MGGVASPYELSQGVRAAFGDTEENARLRQKKEDDNAAAGMQMSAWDIMKSFGSDALSGISDMAKNPKAVWKVLRGE